MKQYLSTRVCLSICAGGVAAALMCLAVAAPAPAGRGDAAEPVAALPPDTVARGKYLVTVAGCNDCHTPWKTGAAGPEPDMSRMLSGHPEAMQLPSPPQLPEGPWVVSVAATNTAWSGPWGVSYTANLTPDLETGLGKWTLRDFSATIRTGRHMGRGRAILPPMPIRMYRNFTDDDLAAIYSYLRTIPIVKNHVPEPLPPANAGVRQSDDLQVTGERLAR
jgi:mono/diheme cytochrome c family protein